MKRFILPVIFVVLMLPLFAQTTTPRVYVQRVVLDNGENPKVTVLDKKSAPEYKVQTWIKENPKNILSTEKHSIHHVSLKEVGDGEKFPKMVIITVQLGNFKKQWRSGQTLHVKVTHKKTKKTVEWDIVIPEGTNLIKMLDEPRVIPPFSKKK